MVALADKPLGAKARTFEKGVNRRAHLRLRPNPAATRTQAEASLGLTDLWVRNRVRLTNLNRWYDAAVGRWISEDPIEFAGGDGNLYRYVGNNPAAKIDANGLQQGPSDHERKQMVEYVDSRIKMLEDAANDGIDETFRDAFSRATQLAHAGGYRSNKLRDFPDWFQDEVDELENNLAVTLVCTAELLLRPLNPRRSYDDGFGDDWYMMEAGRWRMIKDRIDGHEVIDNMNDVDGWGSAATH